MSTIAILLPCLNSRTYLGPRVESLVRQTYSNWQAIVLDSGSTDGSWEFFQTVAAKDARFLLHRIPREGLYAALNRGMQIATADYFCFATCDDTMAPEFLATMLDALSKCPDAGLAACDALFINERGEKLSESDLIGRLSAGAIRTLLRSDRVRGAANNEERFNYRPPPHDCILHYTGRSLYYSLTQLLIRVNAARAIGGFETNVGSVADFRWLIRLTNGTGTVHVPRKLATWRFHGEQLSIYHDSSRRVSVAKMCEAFLPEVRRQHPGLLTNADCQLLLAACKITAADSTAGKIGAWIGALIRIIGFLLSRPALLWRMIGRTGWRLLNFRQTLPMIVLQAHRLAPNPL